MSSVQSQPIRSCISYMPAMLPDELLYSLLGWVVTVNALKFPKEYVERLFGFRNVVPCVDLPTHLESLHHRLGSFAPAGSAEQLIDIGTIYPYHRPFLTLEHHQAIQDILAHGPGIGLKTLMGRVANRFGASPPLRYCPACIENDISLYQRPYWHRSHQLPGVTCCTKHGLELIVHVFPGSLTDKLRLVLPPIKPNPSIKWFNSGPQQMRFAELSQNLLEAALPAQDPIRRRAIYTGRISDLGFVTRSAHIDYSALAAALRCHYGEFEGFPHQVRLLSTPAHPLGWLRALIDRPSRSSHPICHLLLIGYLFETVEAFIDAMRQTDLAGVQCHNDKVETPPLAPSKDVDSQQDRLFHDCSLSCREVAQMLKLSVTTVVSRRRALGVPIAERRKYLHPHRLAAVTKALSTGTSPQFIAARYDVSLSTVYRLLAQSLALTQNYVDHKLERQRVRYRRIWRRAVNKHRDAGIAAARAIASAAYAWLYRHDRAWLQQTRVMNSSAAIRKPRVEWAKRDRELCRRAQRYVRTLKTQVDRPRISKTRILRFLGEAMVRANMDRLPRLQSDLVRLAETPISFQHFRIDQAIDQLREHALPVRLWRIQRTAGIRNWTRPLRAYARHKMTLSAKFAIGNCH